MTSDQNMSEVPTHQDAPPISANAVDHEQDNSNGSGEGSGEGPQIAYGMGQSKSSRRRRRKRKNKVVAAPPAQAAGETGEAVQPAAPAAAAPQPQPAQGQQPSSGKRWKKKFRDRDRSRPQTENPGNSFQPGNTASGYSNGFANGNGGGFKRKGKQRKDRSFVGPMDHSYRAANGNFAEASPSTIEVHGNHHGHGHSRNNGNGLPRYNGDAQPIDYSQGRTVPIPENAPTKIYFFIEDLFFLAKIQETARKLGVKIAFAKNDKEKDIVSELSHLDEEHRPALIVFDLNNTSAKPLTLIPKLKTKLKRGTSIIGFLSHIQGDLKAKAVEAGCDTVMPRAAFSQNLPNLLRRYGAHEDDEQNFNQ